MSLPQNRYLLEHKHALDLLQRRSPPDYNARIRTLLAKHGIPQVEGAARLSLATKTWVPLYTFQNWCRTPGAKGYRAAPFWAWLYLRANLEGR